MKTGKEPRCTKGSMCFSDSDDDGLNRHLMPCGISELNEGAVSYSREVSPFKYDSSSIFSEDTAIAPHVDGSGGGYSTMLSQSRSQSPYDGYDWRKYGQPQVTGSQNPHSYYRCTFRNCPVKKKVERSQDGQITNIEYKGTHNHARPQLVAGYLVADGISELLQSGGIEASSEHTFGAMSGITTLETSKNSVSFETGVSSPRFVNSSGKDEFVELETGSKRRRWKDSDHVRRQPKKMVSQTMGDVDIIDDGYKWRKYGQKPVKGKPHPRSYYKGATAGCPARKHVERASHDMRLLVTTYHNGNRNHNHDVHQQPPAVPNPSSAVGEQQDAQGEEVVDPPQTPTI